ncbi:helix-turn-helix transcriptional regulator [Leucobacter luti]|uniref:helix-turn-helix transcriptional regulator n=1 Tax=Leucobacter luti TaxID=340320 RepID=UPI001052E247|nr:AraC family transcriptional regulator [Leucobacter luti]MCW2287735.1 AraC-like DNA-binding protein/mannose-6-phosphate isomerase-like protein (cupin superfamily) [Leucobacter luti]
MGKLNRGQVGAASGNAVAAMGAAGLPVTGATVPEGYLLRTRYLKFVYEDEQNSCTPRTHAHPEHVVFWPERSFGAVEVRGELRTVSLGEGLWVPAGTPHAVPERDGDLLALHVTPAAVPGRGSSVAIVQMIVAARELLLYLADAGMPREERIQAQRVCLNLIATDPTPKIHLPIPHDPRIAQICRRILVDPADDQSIEHWALQLSVSSRTLTRAFRVSTGTTFGQWRTLARMELAVRLLDQGVAVGDVARRVGYRTMSAFSVAFQRELGTTPKEFHPSLVR